MTYLIVTKLMLVHLLLFLGFPWDGDNLTTDIIICTLRIIPLGFVVVVVVIGSGGSGGGFVSGTRSHCITHVSLELTTPRAGFHVTQQLASFNPPLFTFFPTPHQI